MSTVNSSVLDQAFLTARTPNRFTDRPLSDELLRTLYDTLKWAPTACNAQPARYLFVKSAEAKLKLKPALMGGNVDKVMSAPVTVIVATDPVFYDRIPQLLPAAPQMRDFFVGNLEYAKQEGFRNSSLSAAYLIVAARLLGLDCGPMTGFDPALVNKTFFADSGWQANMIVNLGYGDASANYPRAPRLEFSDAARII